MTERVDPGATADPAAHANGRAAAETGPARALTLHILHMLATRMDAAGIALDTEMQLFSARLKLKVVAGAAVFLAAWAGIVLIAIALPEAYRVPVLGAVVALLVIGAVLAWLLAARTRASNEIGSMRWFLDGLKQDVDVLTRSLARKDDAASPAATRDSTESVQ